MSEEKPISLPPYQQMKTCRYCGRWANFHVTVVEDGEAFEYHVCLQHASQVGAVMPIPCEKCGMAMQNSREGQVRFLICPTCEFKRPYVEPPAPKMPTD
jgi:hypothetical protein